MYESGFFEFKTSVLYLEEIGLDVTLCGSQVCNFPLFYFQTSAIFFMWERSRCRWNKSSQYLEETAGKTNSAGDALLKTTKRKINLAFYN